MLLFVVIMDGMTGVICKYKFKKNLDQHLMSGLNYDGIPENLKNTSFPFPYNNFEYLLKLIKKNIGVIKMEVMRNIEPKDNFLQKIRKICDQKNNFNF